MGEKRIEAVALGVVIERGHILLQPVAAWLIPSQPYRALGGFIEFGERAADAVVREFGEELSRRVEVVRLLSVNEHIADFEKVSVHDIGFYYLLRFSPGNEPGDLAPLPLFEQDAPEGGGHSEAHWIPMEELRAGTQPVYPPALLEILSDAIRTV